MELDWLNPNIEMKPCTNLSDSSLYLPQDLLQSCIEHSDLDESSVHLDSQFSASHTRHSDDGPFIFDYEDLNLFTTNDGDDENNDDTCPTDTNSSQHSASFGSDSAPSSHQLLNVSDQESVMLENPHSQRNRFKFERSSTNDTDTNTTSSSYKHYDSESGRRSYCLGNSNSKNAVAARDNRLKKKKYISSLEESVKNLRAQNDYLLEQSNITKNTLSGLQCEVSYLRRVIANQSVLSSILQNVMKTPGIKLSTSLNYTTQSNDCRKERVAHDNSNDIYVKSEQRPSADCDEGGVINSSSQTDQITTSSNNSKKKPKQNTRGKKVAAGEEIRIRQDQVKEKNITVDIEHSDESTDSFSPDDDINGGICLHVSGHNVSLEFCSHCSKNANLRVIADHSYFKQQYD